MRDGLADHSRGGILGRRDGQVNESGGAMTSVAPSAGDVQIGESQRNPTCSCLKKRAHFPVQGDLGRRFMWACRCLTTAVFAALALQISLQAQECRLGSGREAFHLYWPYTAEYHEKNGTLDGEGRPGPIKEDVLIVASDSQGRFLWHWTRPDGRSTSRVLDQVDAEEIGWSNESTKVKIMKYATPVAGRPSCWQGPSSERFPSTGRTLTGEYHAFCAPAGQNQPPGCLDVCEAERLAKALPPEKKEFPKCEAAPGQTSEDLGMDAIRDIPAHGCRWTSPSPFPEWGNVVSENWWDEYGLILRQMGEYSNGLKGSQELISLSRDEPSLAMFQPPNGYEIVTLEMDEVPCKQPTAPLH